MIFLCLSLKSGVQYLGGQVSVASNLLTFDVSWRYFPGRVGGGKLERECVKCCSIALWAAMRRWKQAYLQSKVSHPWQHDTLGQTSLCCGGCSAYCRAFSSIVGLDPLGARSPFLSVVTAKISRRAECLLGTKITHSPCLF